MTTLIANNILSGIKDIDQLILLNLKDEELNKVCQVNKYVNSLCNDDMFWMKRLIFIEKIDIETLKYIKDYLEFKKWKKFYIFLKECIKIEFDSDDTVFSVSEIINRFIPRIELINEFINLLEFPKWINSKIFIRDMVKRDSFKYFYDTKSDRDFVDLLLLNVSEIHIIGQKAVEKIKSKF